MFGGGKSPMYNRIAQMSVLYEDLRIEVTSLHKMVVKLQGISDVSPQTYRILYHQRRSLISLSEFRGALNQLCADQDFKKAIRNLPPLHKNGIGYANKEFERHASKLKKWRDDFGGHYLFNVAEYATAHFPPEAVGKLEWMAESKEPFWLKLDYATEIILAGLQRTLGTSENLMEDLTQANETISDLYRQAQTCMYSLVAAFILPRMELIA